MKTWHIRIGKYARAFTKSPSFIMIPFLFYRGWRRFNNLWWSKPSKNQQRLEKRDE